VSALLATAEDLVVSPYVVAELDYLVASRHGVDDELAVLDELTGGAWHLAAFDEEQLHRAREVIASHRDQHIGVANASTWCWLSATGRARSPGLDRRHFDVLRSFDGRYFEVLPRVG
jgi:predicted nucleic acid-binding protein